MSDEKTFQVIEGGYIASLPKARDGSYSWVCPHDETSMVIEVLAHPVITQGKVVDSVTLHVCAMCLAQGRVTTAGT